LVVEAATILYNATLILFLFREVWLFEKNKDLNRINVSTKWIIHSISIGGSLVIFWIGATFILKTQTEFAFNIYYPLWIGISALVLFLGTRANMELNIVSDRKRIRKIKQVNSKTSNKLVSRKQKSSQNTYYEIINEIVNSKLYLDPTISLNSVADKFRFSGNYISQLFGKHSGFGFNDFINKLRVEEAKKMLNDKKFSNYTTVAIGLESGFNSKSTFFAVFKKHTGVTPSEFKNSLKK
jgi:YesN/AraC family two-component response regulator